MYVDYSHVSIPACLIVVFFCFIQRCPLESLVLNVKVLDIGEPRSILRLALEPPHLSDIEKTILNLKEVRTLNKRSYAELSTVQGRCLVGVMFQIKSAMYGRTFEWEKFSGFHNFTFNHEYFPAIFVELVIL